MSKQTKQVTPSGVDVKQVVLAIFKALYAANGTTKTGRKSGVFHRSLAEAVGEYFHDPAFPIRPVTDALLAEGLLEGHPVKGGFVFHLPGTLKPKVDYTKLFANAGLELPAHMR